MTKKLQSPRSMVALGRVQRILAKHGVPIRVSDGWSYEDLYELCAHIDDVELMRSLAVLQVESGNVDSNITHTAA